MRIHKQFLVSLVNSKRRCTNRERKKKHTHQNRTKWEENRNFSILCYWHNAATHYIKLSNRIFLNYVFHKSVLIYLASATQYSFHQYVCYISFVVCTVCRHETAQVCYGSQKRDCSVCISHKNTTNIYPCER